MATRNGPYRPRNNMRKATQKERDALFDFVAGRSIHTAATKLGTTELTLDKVLSGGIVTVATLEGILERIQKPTER